jgi:hypothetical protein
MSRNDPVGKEYYSPLAQAETLADVAFYAAALASIAVLLIDQTKYKLYSDAVQIVFVIAVIIVFGFGISTRLYWSARAQEKRCADFISNAFGIPLIHNTSTGYYNNTQTDPIKRVGAALLENSFFSAEIARRMLRSERLSVALYTIAWVSCALYRKTDLAFVSTVAQVVFSEQIISRWLRLEWLHRNFENIYDDTYAVFQATNNFNTPEFRARIIYLFTIYETRKAQAGISLSSRIFNKENANLSAKWQKIALALHL